MNNGYQKSNGCGADKEGWKFFKTFFFTKLQSKHVRPLAYNVQGVYEVGAFKAKKFIPPPKFNCSTKAECLIISPNLINTLLAVVAVF